jgi:hypothetical protein
MHCIICLLISSVLEVKKSSCCGEKFFLRFASDISWAKTKNGDDDEGMRKEVK